MKILFLSGSFPTPHDPTRAVFNLRMCEALAAHHEVRVVCPVEWTQARRSARGAPTVDALLDVTYPTYYFLPRFLRAERGLFMWWSLRRHLRALARTWRPDVTLTYWAHPDGEVAIRWRAESGVPVVQVIGGSDVLLLQNDARRWARVRRVLMSADAVVTIGQHLAKTVIQTGVPADRVRGVQRPVDPDRFSPGSRGAARRRLGLPDTGAVLVWVGRFHKIKGLDVLIDAFAALRRSRPDACLCLVGEGPELPRIQEQVEQAGLSDVVRFAGAVAHDELVHWYRAADVTVLPSLSEGIPNVLLESMACGTPFVASRVGGIPEIADATLDRLVPPGVPAPLTAALTDILSAPDRTVRATLPGSPDAFAHQLGAILASVSAPLLSAVGIS